MGRNFFISTTTSTSMTYEVSTDTIFLKEISPWPHLSFAICHCPPKNRLFGSSILRRTLTFGTCSAEEARHSTEATRASPFSPWMFHIFPSCQFHAHLISSSRATCRPVPIVFEFYYGCKQLEIIIFLHKKAVLGAKSISKSVANVIRDTCVQYFIRMCIIACGLFSLVPDVDKRLHIVKVSVKRCSAVMIFAKSCKTNRMKLTLVQGLKMHF